MAKYNFQQQVKRHLEKYGFEVVVKSQFPEIIAYKQLNVRIKTHINYSDKQKTILLDPFVVFNIGCKVNKRLTKKEKRKAEERVKKGKCNAFFIAYKKGKEVYFDGVLPIVENEEYPRYTG